MKKLIASVVVFIVLSTSGFAQNIYPIIPLPQQIIAAKGNFIVDKNVIIQDFTKSEAVNSALFPLKNKIVQTIGIPLRKSIAFTTAKTIQIRLSNTIANAEGYQLRISLTQISIKAKTSAGVFYAVQSLLQLIQPGSNYSLKIPCATIIDEPRFAYRGIMLDVARHFMPINFIKKYIDELARLKINRFHWHLTDGQAFRFESKKYPLLHYAKSAQWPTNEGFYSQKDIKELVKYAQERSITIIPEIDVPSHSQALLTAYPEYGCLDSLGKNFNGQGELCPNEKSIAFVKNLLDELMAVFPSKAIHIGGDEASKANWKNCPVCKKRMKDLDLNTVDELQSSFVTNLAKHLNSKGRTMIGWDEIMDGGLAPNATVMAWRSIENGTKAAQMKHPVIMSPTSHCYLDYYQSENPNEPTAYNGYISLAKIYSLEPLPNKLNAQESAYILGVQANLWTEQVATGTHAEYMTFPRAVALAEVAWSNPNQKNYADFIDRMAYYLNGLDERKVNYAKHFYEIKTNVNLDSNNRLMVSLSTEKKDTPLYYTLDGSSPTTQSQLYKSPFALTKPTVIKMASVMKNEMVDESISYITINKATGIKVELSEPPSKYYNKGGIAALTNGVFGATKRFNDYEWLGWDSKGVEALLNFNKTAVLTNVVLSFFHQPSSWVWLPRKIEMWGSIDGVNYKLLSEQAPEPPNTEGVTAISFEVPQTSIKYLKIRAQSFGVIPNNYTGAGNQSWFFIDEIVVN